MLCLFNVPIIRVPADAQASGNNAFDAVILPTPGFAVEEEDAGSIFGQNSFGTWQSAQSGRTPLALVKWTLSLYSANTNSRISWHEVQKSIVLVLPMRVLKAAPTATPTTVPRTSSVPRAHLALGERHQESC